MADLHRRLADPAALRRVRIVPPELPQRDRAPRTTLRLPRPLRVALPLTPPVAPAGPDTTR